MKKHRKKGKIHRKIIKEKIKKWGKLLPHRLYDEIPIEVLEDEKANKN